MMLGTMTPLGTMMLGTMTPLGTMTLLGTLTT
jgi:hypothetical protein